jgi:hypothetical protein
VDRPKWEVADVFRRYAEAYREKHGGSMSTAQRRVMIAIEVCRTAALGGQIEQCDACGHQRIRYYGFLGNRYRQQKLARCRELLGMQPPVESPESPEDYRNLHEELTGVSLRECPVCHRGRMFTVETLAAHRSPAIKDTS